MAATVLISGDFKADDGWGVPLVNGHYPPCPDCGDPLRERLPEETYTGLPDISSDAGAKEIACGCGSLFAVVTVVAEVEFFSRLRRKRVGFGTV